MPEPKGPGLNNATKAMMSSKSLGCKRLIKSFIPRDSSWNTAVVLVAFNRSKVASSSRGIVSMLTSSSPLDFLMLLIVFTAQSTIVSVRKPRKSNLTKPTASTSSLSNWLTKLEASSSQYKGVKSVSFDGEITTPPACLPALRTIPSNDFAKSISPATSSSSL